jgi:hypothetical protein
LNNPSDTLAPRLSNSEFFVTFRSAFLMSASTNRWFKPANFFKALPPLRLGSEPTPGAPAAAAAVFRNSLLSASQICCSLLIFGLFIMIYIRFDDEMSVVYAFNPNVS